MKDKFNEIKIISEPDFGIYDALNKGISTATGDIVGFLHSDDMFNNKFVLENINKHFMSGEYDGIYGDLNYVEKDNTLNIVH